MTRPRCGGVNITMSTKPGIRVSIAMLLFAAILPLAGCAGAEEFRSVAGGTIQAGVQTVANGIIDGLFAVLDPDDLD